MIKQYKMVSIVYGGSGAQYAKRLNELIKSRANANRYPINSLIVMDNIMTGDLLENVMELFQKSEICVAILTADDCCINNGTQVYRLRQNVIFELGMAVFRLGRNRCILLSDFDRSDPRYELPSDIQKMDIRHFTEDNIDEVFGDVLDKILQLSRSSADLSTLSEAIPQYNNLLDRDVYYVDYQDLFCSYSNLSSLEGNAYLKQILNEWEKEIKSLNHYDERSLFFFERIVFVPMFGRVPWVIDWCKNCLGNLSQYSREDVDYCGKKRLEFISNLIRVLCDYTRIKLQNNYTPGYSDFEELYESLKETPCYESVKNPLIAAIYHDYLGLICMKMFEFSGEENLIKEAIENFENIMNDYVDKIDLSLNIWQGFITFNLARAYIKHYILTKDKETANKALKLFSRATRKRKVWTDVSMFNPTIRNALSYEYFISKIEHINAMVVTGEKLPENTAEDYKKIESELEAYLSKDEQLEGLRFVQKLINDKRTELGI